MDKNREEFRKMREDYLKAVPGISATMRGNEYHVVKPLSHFVPDKALHEYFAAFQDRRPLWVTQPPVGDPSFNYDLFKRIDEGVKRGEFYGVKADVLNVFAAPMLAECDPPRKDVVSPYVVIVPRDTVKFPPWCYIRRHCSARRADDPAVMKGVKEIDRFFSNN